MSEYSAATIFFGGGINPYTLEPGKGCPAYKYNITVVVDTLYQQQGPGGDSE